jgi:hypothetical protein
MFRGILALTIAVLVSGCVGVGSYTQTQFRSSQAIDRVITTNNGASPTTKQDILNAWGEPKERINNSYEEVWTYSGKGDLAWRGIVVWMIAPIPLLVPVGKNDVHISFDKKGQINGVYVGEVEATFYGCNIGFVCGRFSDVTHPSL